MSRLLAQARLHEHGFVDLVLEEGEILGGLGSRSQTPPGRGDLRVGVEAGEALGELVLLVEEVVLDLGDFGFGAAVVLATWATSSVELRIAPTSSRPPLGRSRRRRVDRATRSSPTSG